MFRNKKNKKGILDKILFGGDELPVFTAGKEEKPKPAKTKEPLAKVLQSERKPAPIHIPVETAVEIPIRVLPVAVAEAPKEPEEEEFQPIPILKPKHVPVSFLDESASPLEKKIVPNDAERQTLEREPIRPDLYFHLEGGVVLTSLRDLSSALATMPPEVWAHHVTGERNDFANWIEHVFKDPKLAEKTLKAESPQDLKLIIGT